MKRFFPFLIDAFLLFGISFLFQSYTNQKNFRIDILGISIFSFILYTAIRWKSFKENPFPFWTLFLTVLLLSFVFLKIAEYDPIQLFPQKLGIKIIALTWILFLLFSFHFVSTETFLILAPFLAIVPVISFVDFMAYPSIPIAIALLLTMRDPKNLDLKNSKTIFLLSILVIFAIIVRDWWDDFALQRAVLLLEAFLFYCVIKKWDRSQVIYLLKAILLFFLLNSLSIYFGIFKDPNFQVTSYHEEIYLIPVSLLASNSLLMIMISMMLWFETNQSRLERGFYVLVLLASLIWFGITVSRNSIGSFLLFLLLVIFLIQKPKNKRLVSYLIVFLVLGIGAYFLFYSEKSILSLGSTSVRFSIWKYYILATIQSNPLFGFGMYPENKIPFVITSGFDSGSLYYIKDYIYNFASFPLAHNLYIQFFGSFGIVGSITFLSILCINFLRKGTSLKKALKNNLMLTLIFFVWLIHEFYDFNSLEISNLFLLVSLLVLYKIPEKNQEISRSNNYNLLPKMTIGFVLSFLTIVSVRFAYIDHYTLKYAKLVTPNNFEYYISKKEEINQTQVNTPMSLAENFFFGNKLFFYHYAIEQNFESKLKLLRYCFDLQSYPAICYSKLNQFQTGNRYFPELKPYFEFFLDMYDPFAIYKRGEL